MAGGAGVELEEERLAFHLGVPREPAVVPQLEEVFPIERALFSVGDEVSLVTSLLVADAQGLVVDREHRVDAGVAVTGDEDEAITEGELRPADVPAHPRAQG